MLLCVNRDNVKNEFKDVFKNFIGDKKNIMYLTGIPGIGKSVLIEFMHRDVKYYFNNVLNVYINFNTNGSYFSFFDLAYKQLRAYGVKFYMYELARQHLFQLTGDEKYKIKKEKDNYLAEFVALPLEFIEKTKLKVIASGGIIVLRMLFGKLSDRYEKYLLQQCDEISDTKQEDVIKNLGVYFIRDINTYCEENNKNICYFIDTFEKCREKTDFSEADFIKTFVLPSKYSFWVIGGTSENILNKFENKFDYFSCSTIENFDQKKYVEEILNKQYSEYDKDIIDSIFNLSKGYPASVELIAQTYKKLKEEADEVSFDELANEIDSADFYNHFFEKYYRRHVIADDLKILAFLSCFDSWTYREYEYYASAENIGNPKIKFEKLKQYVIVKENFDGSFFIIDVAKNCLLNADKFATAIIYRQAFDYMREDIAKKFEERLNQKNSEKLYVQAIAAIRLGAKILASDSSFTKEYYDWFIKFEQSLSPKMLYELKGQSISCFINETQQFLKKAKKKDIHLNCFLQCLYDYAWTYCYQRNYKKALEIIKKYEAFAQRIIKNTADERIVKARYTKAVILENQGEYGESLMLHKEILEIRRNGTNQRAIGVSLNCIGFLYMLMNDFTNSKKYFEESLTYRSVEQDLRGFCTVHANLSKMYFLKSLYTNNSKYLYDAKNELDIALAHLSEENMPALYKSWEVRYVILQAQKLRFAKKTSVESYRKILSVLQSFVDMIEKNPQFGMRSHIMTTENNIAVVMALMGDSEAYELMEKCLFVKESFYDIKSNPKSKPCSITRNNLEAIKEKRLNDLIFEY